MARRLVEAKEAEVAALGEALKRAAESIGMPDAMQRQLGAALRVELEQNDEPGEVVDAEVVALPTGKDQHDG